MITLICHKYSSRLEYVLDFLSNLLGISIQIQMADDVKNSTSGVLINYTNEAITNSFSIYNDGLLFENHMREKGDWPKVRTQHNLLQLFPAESDHYDINFDMFSAIFFCLSRYEEYLPFTADEHGRFAASQSHAFTHSYLKLPVVDLWVNYFIERLNSHANLDLKSRHSFEIKPTIDVDSAWAFQHRSQTHKAASAIKNVLNVDVAALNEKRKSQSNQSDPYDTFAYLRDSLADHDPIFFFLMNFKRPYDTAHYVELSVFETLLKSIHQFSEIGIHPSYASYGDSTKVKNEKAKLEMLLQTQIVKSRQHFLRMSFPDTFTGLIENGIREDYSLGYADQIGFRAGTSQSFRFYHLHKEEQTELWMHPFCMMDVTLKQYEGYSVEEAIFEVNTMKEILKETNGCLRFIWHNSSFAEFEGWARWEAVFEELLRTDNIREPKSFS